MNQQLRVVIKVGDISRSIAVSLLQFLGLFLRSLLSIFSFFVKYVLLFYVSLGQNLFL